MRTLLESERGRAAGVRRCPAWWVNRTASRAPSADDHVVGVAVLHVVHALRAVLARTEPGVRLAAGVRVEPALRALPPGRVRRLRARHLSHLLAGEGRGQTRSGA